MFMIQSGHTPLIIHNVTASFIGQQSRRRFKEVGERYVQNGSGQFNEAEVLHELESGTCRCTLDDPSWIAPAPR